MSTSVSRAAAQKTKLPDEWPVQLDHFHQHRAVARFLALNPDLLEKTVAHVRRELREQLRCLEDERAVNRIIVANGCITRLLDTKKIGKSFLVSDLTRLLRTEILLFQMQETTD